MNIHNKDGMFFRKIWAFATRKGQENSQKRRKWEQEEIMKHFFSIFIALGGEKSKLKFLMQNCHENRSTISRQFLHQNIFEVIIHY